MLLLTEEKRGAGGARVRGVAGLERGEKGRGGELERGCKRIREERGAGTKVHGGHSPFFSVLTNSLILILLHAD